MMGKRLAVGKRAKGGKEDEDRDLAGKPELEAGQCGSPSSVGLKRTPAHSSIAGIDCDKSGVRPITLRSAEALKLDVPTISPNDHRLLYRAVQSLNQAFHLPRG